MFELFSRYKSILIIRSNAVSDFRMDMALRHLKNAGYDVEIITEVPYYKASHFDVFLCCRPGTDMIPFLNSCLVAGKRVIVDLDDDFNAIPKHNPAFTYTGAGHPTYLRELKKLLRTPGVITTYASPLLADRYHIPGIVIPNCFDEENPAWFEDKKTRKTINIGFSGTATHREDFNLVEPTLKKLFIEYPETKLIVNLDDQIFGRFLDLPESRKLFLPGVLYQDYPLVYRYIDILVVPLKDTYFNRAKSDIKLLECGATRTTWVASDLPFYREWASCGLLVQNNDWETPLRQLITGRSLWSEYSDAGYLKSLTRSSAIVCNKWIEIMETLFNENPIP